MIEVRFVHSVAKDSTIDLIGENDEICATMITVSNDDGIHGNIDSGYLLVV